MRFLQNFYNTLKNKGFFSTEPVKYNVIKAGPHENPIDIVRNREESVISDDFVLDINKMPLRLDNLNSLITKQHVVRHYCKGLDVKDENLDWFLNSMIGKPANKNIYKENFSVIGSKLVFKKDGKDTDLGIFFKHMQNLGVVGDVMDIEPHDIPEYGNFYKFRLDFHNMYRLERARRIELAYARANQNSGKEFDYTVVEDVLLGKHKANKIPSFYKDFFDTSLPKERLYNEMLILSKNEIKKFKKHLKQAESLGLIARFGDTLKINNEAFINSWLNSKNAQEYRRNLNLKNAGSEDYDEKALNVETNLSNSQIKHKPWKKFNLVK